LTIRGHGRQLHFRAGFEKKFPGLGAPATDPIKSQMAGIEQPAILVREGRPALPAPLRHGACGRRCRASSSFLTTLPGSNALSDSVFKQLRNSRESACADC
jgi:hypothetical protein